MKFKIGGKGKERRQLFPPDRPDGGRVRVGRGCPAPGLAEGRRGAEPGLAPRASGRKDRLGASTTRQTPPRTNAHAHIAPAPPLRPGLADSESPSRQSRGSPFIKTFYIIKSSRLAPQRRRPPSPARSNRADSAPPNRPLPSGRPCRGSGFPPPPPPTGPDSPPP